MKTKDKISLAFTGVLVFCALIITGFVIRQEFFPTPSPPPKIREVENWQNLKLNGQKEGPNNASVQLVEFFDYQCPFCKNMQPVIKKVRKKYPNKLSIVYQHYPLNGHKFAFNAAMAAECAKKQQKFNDFHDLLFANQDQLGTIRYQELATDAGVENIASFNRCLSTNQTKSIIESSVDLANNLGIDAIPTLIINGKLITGALSEKRLERLVTDEF